MSLVAVSACLGFLAVGLGAFGAHGLADRLDADGLALWQTATLYALIHAVAALSIGLAPHISTRRAGGWTICLGVLVFSGSLYAMALGAPKWLGAITPLGGAAFLLGWALIAISVRRQPE